MAQLDYRPYIPGPAETRIAGGTAEEHTAERLKAPRPRQLFDEWAALADRPFRGIADGGGKREGLFALQPEDAPVEAMAAAAGRLHDRLSPEERARTRHPVGSPLWHRWQNTEMLVEEHGLRLEHAAPPVRALAMEVVRASMSEAGFGASVCVMRLNAFLGDVLGAPGVLNEWSYTFCLFGEPSTAGPWGWQLFGHHLSLNCLTLGGQMVLTPNGNDYGIDLLRQHYSRPHAGGGTPGHADDRG